MPYHEIPTVLLFGAPGVGKGTQGRILGTIPGFYHLSCGDVFRSLDMRSEEGKEVYRYSSRGELVPDDVTIRIWRKGLESLITLNRFCPHEEILILDGIPRNPQQAQILNEYIRVHRVIYLVCSEEERMIDRIKRRAIHENRADDANESVIRKRFEVYRRESEPVLQQYPSQIIHTVDAIGTPAAVLRQVLDVLVPVQEELFGHGSSAPKNEC